MKIFLIFLVEMISLPGSHWSLLEPFLLSSSGYVRMFLVYNIMLGTGEARPESGRSWNVVIVVEVELWLLSYP